MQLRVTKAKTPVGEIVAWSTGEGVCALGWSDAREQLEGMLEKRFGEYTEKGKDATLAKALRKWVKGDPKALHDVRVDVEGTKFQKKVWARLRKIPVGETLSYAALAKMVGSSPRAVGNANGQNPVSIIVPCHRVIGSDGSLTGYAYGTDRKAWLLEHEAS